MVNLHFSLLPRWRGAAPVERAILAGDDRTGVCVMAVEEGLDTGGIYARAEVPIGADETAAELRAELVGEGTTLLLDQLSAGLGPAEPQVRRGHLRREAHRRRAATRLGRPADRAPPAGAGRRRLDHVPGPSAQGVAHGPRRGPRRHPRTDRPRTRVAGPWRPVSSPARVGTGDGALELVEVQPEGKGRQAAAAWAQRRPARAGERLGS